MRYLFIFTLFMISCVNSLEEREIEDKKNVFNGAYLIEYQNGDIDTLNLDSDSYLCNEGCIYTPYEGYVICGVRKFDKFFNNK